MGWFGKIFGVKKYQHNGYGRTITRSDGQLVYKFTAIGTQTVDSIRIMLGNVGGTNATNVTIRIIDVAQGKMVGNAKVVPLGAGAAYSANVVSGFAVALQKARTYAITITASFPDVNALTAPAQSSSAYSVQLQVGGFAAGAIPANWRVWIAPGHYIPMGGQAGYQSTGTATRTLDVTAFGATAPSGNGVVTFSDVVPAGTSMTITAYYTNTASLAATSGTAGWTLHGAIASGDTIPAAIYWRMVIAMTANGTLDDAPNLSTLSVTYLSDPLVFGTHGQRVQIQGYGNSYYSQSVKAVDKISSSSSVLEPKAKTVMVGKMTIELAPEALVESLFQRKLRGRRVMVRAGYSDVPDTLLFYEGIVRDLAFHSGRYILTIQDPLELADISIPRTRHPAWNVATAYVGGDIVVDGNKSYLCILANTGNTPSTSPTYWQDNGTVWVDVVYTSGSHLCDIAVDILTNRVNIPSEKIDIASIDAVKAAKPSLTIASTRTISTQEKALAMLTEIVWLCESYWTIREGRLSMLQEASTSDVPVEYIGPDDIKESLQYRRGWSDMKNECLILTQYLGTGTGPEQYQNGIAVADSTSIQDHRMTSLLEFKDRWGLAEATLTTIATNYVNRWKNGRRWVRVDASMRLLPVETGDVIGLSSAQLPQGDVSQLNCVVMQKDIDWIKQTLQLTLLEVT